MQSLLGPEELVRLQATAAIQFLVRLFLMVEAVVLVQ
jgi:hypothetical protein